MKLVPDHIPAPIRFCSPGLERLLIRREIVPADAVRLAKAKKSNTMLISSLAAAGAADEGLILQAVARELGVVVATAQQLLKSAAAKSFKAPSLQDGSFFIQHRCLPIEQRDGRILVAFADPLDVETTTRLEIFVQSKLQIAIASEGEIVAALGRLFTGFENSSDDGSADDIELSTDLLSAEIDAPDVETGSKAAPIIKLVNKILLDAISAGASDIHFEPTEHAMEVRFRIDGVMSGHQTIPKKMQLFLVTRVKLLAGMNITERRRPQDGRFSLKLSGAGQRDMRASTVPTPFGEKVVLRLLRADFEGLDFTSLGMPADIQRQFEEAIASTDRIVVVTGPTGSGKTTTLYAAIAHLKRGTNTIVTVEDPIEFRIDGLTQIQIDTKIGVTFASGMRSILRQDPDVIFVGEIRDLETAEIAFQAAQTGHFVLTSLHTNSAPSAVVRLRDLGIEPFVISSSLGAVMAQRLVRRLCQSCKQPADGEQKNEFARRFGNVPDGLSRSVGCQQCDNQGYRGRQGIYSLLVLTTPIRDIIRKGGGEDEIAAAARANGMLSLADSAYRLVEQGVTTLSEAERVVGTLPRDVRSIGMTTGNGASSGAVTGKVLLVDDDPSVRLIVARALEKASFTVVQAANKIEALEALKTSGPDLVLCDLDMPGSTPKDLITELGERCSERRIPLLVLTHMNDEDLEIEMIEAGANDYLRKSASLSLLTAKVRRWLASA